MLRRLSLKASTFHLSPPPFQPRPPPPDWETLCTVGEFTRGAANAVQTVVKTEGLRGMFAGYGSFIIRDLPFDAIEFVAYEQLKKAWVKYKGSDIRPHESAVIGKWTCHHWAVMCGADTLHF